MTLGVGFIFMDAFKHAPQYHDPLAYHKKSFAWSQLGFAVLVTAPAVIFHELAHKFFAILLGLEATFHAAYTFLGIGILMKLMNFGFVFFVPGYVSISGANPLQNSLIAFAGPALNGILFLAGFIVLKTRHHLSPKQHLFWALTRRINGFLFVLNMIPVPFFDGGHVVRGLYQTLF